MNIDWVTVQAGFVLFAYWLVGFLTGWSKGRHKGYEQGLAYNREPLTFARREIRDLKHELRKFYAADGTFVLLATPEEAVKRRIEAAQLVPVFSARIANFETQIRILNERLDLLSGRAPFDTTNRPNRPEVV